MGYRDTYDGWRRDPAGFWMDAAGVADWFEPPGVAFDPNAGVYGRWFPDAVCNTCHNALDRHVAEGRADQPALVYDSPVTATVRTFTYAELLREVQAFALVLRDLGVEAGDRVVIYMPMVPEAVVGMLACARIGAVHSVVFGGFAARELATRIDDAAPKVVLSATCGIEVNRVVAYKPLLDEALTLVRHRPQACVILGRERLKAELMPGRDHDWGALRDKALAALDGGRECPCARLAATDPLYILYTSGTTGKPKGIVRDNGGHMVALRWTMDAIYGMAPGEVFWAASDVGWVVGHSYIVYGPLLHGCTTVLYEGKPVGTPDAGAFWRVIADYDVKVLFTAPTAIRAIRKEDSEGRLLSGYDLSCLRALFLAGERADPETVRWAEGLLDVPVIDHWWQTETGCAVAANPLGLERLPVKHGSPAVPMPGYAIRILDGDGQPVGHGEMGSIVLEMPLPPGAAVTLWNADYRFRESYLAARPGFYDTADAGSLDEDGYVWVMGRTDDVINVAGHRLSTGLMEEVVSAHPAVAECAVIGCRDTLKGEVPCGLIVLKAGVSTDPGRVADEVVALVRERIGPVAALRRVVAVDRLPKTRSGKILRATIKRIADGEVYAAPATIEDPTVLAEIEGALASKQGQPG
ncbi:propionyl-CoA synthetase [Methylobacterium sp. XJLW]|uniref:AMP-binding protein n=1 Tax=Methylobacterium sp. XJLW TaxID=739141 RepID=UPI000DAAF302|nr:AMP-binding protein [Methylobacterium sp. XJLW]AWV14952.1 propionyl-CoA synthetase [Methylobacterium sp. XJLW]